MPKDYGITILGDSFLREYVASFNYADKTVSLAKSVDAPVAPPPSSGLPGGLTVESLYVILGVTAIGLVCAACCCVAYCRRKRKGAETVNRAGSFY